MSKDGVIRREHLSRDLGESISVRENSSAKALKQKCARCGLRTSRRKCGWSRREND
jgi:hypothetical protein